MCCERVRQKGNGEGKNHRKRLASTGYGEGNPGRRARKSIGLDRGHFREGLEGLTRKKL